MANLHLPADNLQAYMDQAAALCDARFAALSVEPGGPALLKFRGPASVASSPSIRPSQEPANFIAGRDAAAAVCDFGCRGVHGGSYSGSHSSTSTRPSFPGINCPPQLSRGESIRRMSRSLTLSDDLGDLRKVDAEAELQSVDRPQDAEPDGRCNGGGLHALRLCRQDQVNLWQKA